MNFSELLHHREALLRQARLANLAFAFARLSDYAQRIAHAGLRGPATLHEAEPEAERFWPTLTVHHGNQSVIEEHFLDEDIEELDEILLFLEDQGFDVDYTFDLESMPQRHLPALRRELEKAGVLLPMPSLRPEDSNREAG
ncbi:MAG TPA: hypothetical protein VK477_12135 [Acidobacteriota bacterium]|nr:hypothetical protein [Acidobacteriota bacterium]